MRFLHSSASKADPGDGVRPGCPGRIPASAASMLHAVGRFRCRLCRVRPRKGSSPFLLLFGLLLFLQVASLPIHPGFLFLNPHAAPMTVNCPNKTCCTPLCYLDEKGNHHCVHITDDSRECGISTGDFEPGSVLLSISVVLSGDGFRLPAWVPVGSIFLTPEPIRDFDTAPPCPPPKWSLLS